MDDLKIKGYVLKNPEKVNRALDGSPNDRGENTGGVRLADGAYDKDALLAEYDRLGGLIEKNGDKVATGSFYDFANRRPHEKPKVKFVYFVNGKFVEVDEDKPTPGIVKAAKILKEEEAKVTKKTAKKVAKKAVKKE